MLVDAELERYSRQILLSEIGIEGQEKLKRARILVVGAGGLGSPVLQYLVAAGVGHIGIVDYDVIELTNLNRQVLYTMADLDCPKVLRAAERLKLANPEIHIRPYFQKFNKDSALEIIAEYDIVADCTDQFAARYLINDACVILGKPVVYGAVYQFEGQVTVFNYCNGPTLRCLHPEQPHPLEVPTCAEGGVIGIIAGIIGTLQANELIKIIVGIGEILSGKVLVFNALTCNSYFFHLERDLEASAITGLSNYEEDCSSDESSILQITSEELQDWITDGKDFLIVDVSDPANYADHGFQCLRIPSFHVIEKIHLIPRDRPVVFICPLGIKSMTVVSYLQNKEGFRNMYSLKNGFSNPLENV